MHAHDYLPWLHDCSCRLTFKAIGPVNAAWLAHDVGLADDNGDTWLSYLVIVGGVSTTLALTATAAKGLAAHSLRR